MRGAALQQTVGKTAGRGTDVERARALDVDAEGVQRAFEFLAATAHEPARAFDLDGRTGADVLTSFVCRHAVDADASFHDEAARLRARHAKLLGHGRVEPPHVAFCAGY